MALSLNISPFCSQPFVFPNSLLHLSAPLQHVKRALVAWSSKLPVQAS